MLVRAQKYSLIFLCILAFAFFTRMYRLNIPETYVFDEVYHAVTAKLMSRNDPRAFEWWNAPVEPNTAVDWLHPPLAKYTQALSILAFGENSFGWRFSSVIFGIIVIILTHALVYELTESRETALLAAFLASLDGLLLVQSRIAMNDIHVTAAILGTFLVYTRYRKQKRFALLVLTGVMAGISMGTKWSGVFTLPLIWLYEVLEYVRAELQESTSLHERIYSASVFLFTRLLTLFVLPVLLYVLSYSFMFLQGKGLQHFYELHSQIFWYQTHLTATHPYQSRPIEWFLDLRPVWMQVTYDKGTRGDIYAFGNPVLFWFGGVAVIASLGLGIYTTVLLLIRGTRKKKLLDIFLASPLVFLVLAYSVVWMPWEFSPRIMFFYHYTPAVPLLVGVLAYWLASFWNHSKVQKAVVCGTVLAAVLCFVVWYPHWVGIPVPTAFADTVYFALAQWK